MANLLEKFEALLILLDFAVSSQSWKEHLGHLKNILNHLALTGLDIKASKCHFSQVHVKYLGHLVGQRPRQPTELKVQVIKDFSRQSTKTQIRAFLGLVGCYQRYIPELSVISAPLTDL